MIPCPRRTRIVGVGHPISYLPSLGAIHDALAAMAGSLRPGGVLAFDVCDLAYGARSVDGLASRGWLGGRLGADHGVLGSCAGPVRAPDGDLHPATTTGTWRRDDERHDNVLVDVATIPALLAGTASRPRCATRSGPSGCRPASKVVVGRKDP